MKNVLFTGDTLSEVVRAQYKGKGFNIIPASYDLSEDAVAKLLVDCDGYILGGDEIASEQLLAKAGNRLKAISFFGTGFEKYVDVDYAKIKGITVSNTPGANANSVAEFTVALLLAATKNIVKFSNETKAAKWDRPKTFDISGKTIGIIGFGNIGRLSARMLHNGFGCNIIYSGNSAKPALDQEIASTFVGLNELLSKSDFILVHAGLNENTEKLINEANIGLIKQNAIIINTARAEIIDEESLYDALSNRKILRAAFDVFYEEPINNVSIVENHPILTLPDESFIITPHMAYYTIDAITKMEEMALQNVCEMLQSGDCKYVVNR